MQPPPRGRTTPGRTAPFANAPAAGTGPSEELVLSFDPRGAVFVGSAREALRRPSRASAEDSARRFLAALLDEDRARLLAEAEQARILGEALRTRVRQRGPEGSWTLLEIDLSPHTDEGGGQWLQGLARSLRPARHQPPAPLHASPAGSGPTRAEPALLAHDLGNLLVAVLGHGALARSLAEPGSEVERALSSLLEAADRAAALCRRLQGCGAPHNPPALHLGRAARALLPVLKGLASEGQKISIETLEQPLVAIDALAFDQILVNLCKNAFEAGVARYHAVRVRIQEIAEQGPGLTLLAGAMPRGPLASIRVEDSGPPLTDIVRHRIIRGGFSSKGLKGRGLGLASVAALVSATGGALRLGSSQDLGGALFEVLLPSAPSCT